MRNTQIAECNRTIIPSIPGTPFGGGFYYGKIKIDNELYALILSPKDTGQFKGCWGTNAPIILARAVEDGFRNTEAMAASGIEIALQARELNINGFADWYIPSSDELEILYRTLKPNNWAYYLSKDNGANSSSMPPSLPYSRMPPTQTAVSIFQDGEAEAMDVDAYWSSTQVKANSAMAQNFYDGSQFTYYKAAEFKVRLIRRLIIV